ncbi:hypothetical protein [Sphingomonas sp. IC4-52]|uniref:hypothetical protein n=1 Tax=Sphingomonas sp. IC4-52 TaxID=2887202 RepID=UPI001D10EC49|nr:hypothetical protein [Sphingomonas sp. IC4-52]MCC2979269.1 hypothetical protein [Sphingomonas sp. IC4-52]
MISIGMVWDRAMAVISGRFSILLSLAVGLIIVPPIGQAAIDAVGGSSFMLRSTQMAASLLVFVSASIGAIAITAVASDPDVDLRSALAIGRARLGAFIGVWVIVGLCFVLAALPGLILVATSGFSVAQAQAGGPQDGLNMGVLSIGMVLLLVLVPVMFWATARLVPLGAVIVNERRGIGAIQRSFALTRGMTLKLLGVLILYAIVFVVVLTASTSVVGLIARLLAGSDGAIVVSVTVAAVAALVAGLFSVVQAVFSAQLYAAAREAHDGA